MFFQQFGDVSLWNRDYGAISPGGNVTDFVSNGTEKALTYTIPITAGMLDGNSTYTINIRTDNVPAGGKLSFRYAFVKKGTMATDWTPAPEDTDQAISKITQTADTIRADLANTKGDVASVKATASSLQTQITDNKNNISTVKQTADSLTSTVGQMPAKWQQAINDKASAQVLTNGVDMNNLTTAGTYLIKDFSVKNAPVSAYFMATVDATADHTRVVQRVKRDADNIAYERSNYDKGWTAWERVATGTDVSSIQQTMSGITTRVSNAEGNVSSLQQTAKGLQSSVANAQGDISSLKQTASGLTSRVGNAEGHISQLQQTANGLTSTVSNLHSGDRNYVRGTSSDWSNLTDFNNKTNYCLQLGIFYLGDLKEGDQITLGITLKNAGITSGQMILFQGNGDVKGWTFGVNGSYDIAKWLPAGQTREIRIIKTLSANDVANNTIQLQIRTDNVPAGGTLSAKCVYIKRGSLATDWSPAPEDTDSSISQIKQTADRIQAQVSDNKSNISSVKHTADEVRTDLTNANHDISTLKSRADSLTSSITNANNQISTLQQRADSLTSTLSNGGRNLLSNTREINDPSLWENLWAWDKGDFYNDGINKCQIVQNSTHKWNGLNQYVFVEGGKKYTYSIDAKSGDTSNHTAWFFCNIYDVPGNQNNKSSSMIGSGQVLHYTPTWTRYSFTVTAPTNGYACPSIVRGTTTNELLQLARPQFEYGDTATPWQPSNGDISSLQQTASQLTSDMKDAKGNISTLQQTAGGLTSRVGNAEENISSVQQTAKELKATVGDSKSGLVSTVNAMPGKITSAITASKQATVITSAVDLHNMTTAGYYLLKGALTNSPVTAWAFLRVITSDSGDRVYHRIWKDNGSTVYTEEWTGSWSGWATHINSDNLKSNVITAINQSTEGVSITGSKITLDGNVNVAPGFTLSADYIKAGTMRADRISGGKLNFDDIYVIGLTANSISSGSISGQNLNINLDNGVVEFTKGNLHSTDGGFNISIDTKSFYLDMGNNTKLWIDGNGFHLQESDTQHLWLNKDGLHNYTTSNSNGVHIQDSTLRVLNNNGEGLVAQNGLLQFSTLPTWLNFGANSTLTAQAYGIIGPDKNLFGSSKNGLFVKGREGVVIGTNSYNGETFLGSLFNANSVSGSGISLSDDMTKAALFFTKAPLILAGGPTWDDINGLPEKPYISVGSDWYYDHPGAYMNQSGQGTYTRGNNIIVSSRNTNIIGYDWINFKSFGRIALDADYVHSYPTYLKTTSAGANVFVAPDGALIRSSSARKYKTDIQDADNDYGNKLIELTPQKWIDKAEKKHYEEDPENNKKPGYYYGLIADDLDAAGLDMLVNYGAEGEVEGINYDRLAVALLPVIKSLKDQVASLKKQIKALTK
ncbi:gp58-like family protein [Lactobacillus equicursoris]|nr:gp58-like family protein [Lactobacillus equicursoris]